MKRKLISALGGLGLMLCQSGLFAQISSSKAAGSDGETYTATITKTDLQTVKGFGCCPTWSDNYNITNYPLAQHATYNMGATMIRHCELPGLGDGNGQINIPQANELCAAIQLTVNKHLPYIISSWGPPAGMKTIEVNGSTDATGKLVHLRTDKEQTLCDFVVNIMNYIKNKGLTLPIAYSLQNEPTCQTPWAGCIYDAEQYQRVIKLLRITLDRAGYSEIKLLGPEDGGYYNNDTWSISALYLGGKGFPALKDTALNRAVGAFASHSYDWGKPAYSTIAHLDTWIVGCDTWGKERWMTEFCYGEEQDTVKIYTDNSHALGTIRRFISDMVYIKNNYWFTWSVFDVNDDPASLTFGDGKNSLTLKPTYFVLKKLFSSIPIGSKVRRMTSTDPGLSIANGANMDVAAFVNGNKTVAIIVNPTIAERKTLVNGLSGSLAEVYQTSSTKNNTDMSLISSQSIKNHGISETILLPNSITIIVTK